MLFPEESVHNYLIDNGFIDLKGGSFSNIIKISKNSKISSFSKRNSNFGLNTTFNHYFEKINNKNEK